jgi:hypothetical protein
MYLLKLSWPSKECTAVGIGTDFSKIPRVLFPFMKRTAFSLYKAPKSDIFSCEIQVFRGGDFSHDILLS